MGLDERIRRVITRHVEAGALPGAAWLVAADGAFGSAADGAFGNTADGAFGGEVARGAAGTSGPPDGAPIRPETPFRISSNSKPIVAALAMALVDDGTLRLDAPVDDALPELADRRVLADPAGPLSDTVPARRPITARDCLEFRLGWGIDFTGGPNFLLSAMADRGLATGPPAPQANPPPDEWLRRLGGLPLAYQPGERWLYNAGASVLSVLISRVSGRSLPDLLAQRLTEPMGMRDTAFWLPADRLGPHWLPSPDGAAPEVYDPPDGQWSTPPAFPDGADGLVSSVDDLAAFEAMLRAGGVAADGTRVLSEDAVRAMITDQVGQIDPDGTGWGLGVGCARDRRARRAARGQLWLGRRAGQHLLDGPGLGRHGHSADQPDVGGTGSPTGIPGFPGGGLRRFGLTRPPAHRLSSPRAAGSRRSNRRSGRSRRPRRPSAAPAGLGRATSPGRARPPRRG